MDISAYLSGGVKIKVLEAMARGKVVIGTLKAFEGIPVAHAVNAIIIDELDSLGSLSELLSRIEGCPSQLLQMGINSQKLIRDHFSHDSRLPEFVRLLRCGSPFTSPPL